MRWDNITFNLDWPPVFQSSCFSYLPVLPKVTVSVVPSSSRSSPLTLACEINGFYPQNVSVLWIRNGTVLSETPQIRQNNDGTYRMRRFLTLSLEERERAGQVQCVAQQPHVAQPALSSIEPSAGDSLGNFNKYTACQVVSCSLTLKGIIIENWLSSAKALWAFSGFINCL